MPRRAIIVGNDSGECELIRVALASISIETLTLSSSAEAPDYLRNEKFAVALFNVRMPTPTGIELSRAMRHSGLNLMTPIILVSDDPSPTRVSEAFAADASVFLYKPIDKSRLLSLVRVTQGVIEHEMRRFRRVPFRAKVRLVFDHTQWEGETVDASLNGLLVEGAGGLPVGSLVRVTLELAREAKPIIGTGCIVRVLAGNRMGIQLNQLPVAESGRLQDFLLPLILREGGQTNAINS